MTRQFDIIIFLASAFLLLSSLSAYAQGGKEEFNVDYDHPKPYILGGVEVEGNTYLGKDQILQLSGLREGMELEIPGEQASAIVNRLWQQRYFQNVSIEVDSLSAARDSVWLRIKIEERPRVSQWIYSGIKSGEKKEIEERTGLRRGREGQEGHQGQLHS